MMLLATLTALLGATPASSLDALRKSVAFQGAQLSPDGKQLAWVESVSGPEGRLPEKGIIRVLDLTQPKGEPIRITAGTGKPGHEGNPSWSPDSKSLAFLSDLRSKGQLQLFVGVPGVRSPQQLTQVRGRLAAPSWSRDGKRIAVLLLEGVTDAKGPMGAAPRETGVIHGDVKYQRIAVVDVDTGKLESVSPANLHVYEYDWSPDGKSFAAIGAHGPGDQSWWTAGLFVLSLDGGLRALRQPKLQIARPRWSPDGKRIAFIEGLMSDEDLVGGDLLIVDAAGGEAANLTGDRRSTIGFVHWLDANKLALAEWTDAASGAALVTLDDGRVQTLWRQPEHIGYEPYFLELSIAGDGTAAAVSYAFDRGPEIFFGPLLDRGSWRQPTRANVTLVPPWTAKSLTWKSDGYDVQGWLLEPRDAPKGPGAMVVMVHGGPSWKHDPGSNPIAWALVEAGYRVLLPNPRGSFGQGETFARGNVRDFGGGDLRDILAGIDAARKEAPVDPRRVGMYGWSYGGFMAMWAQTQTDKFQAYVSGAGISNWQSYYGTNRIDTWLIPFFGVSVYDDVEAYRHCSAIEQIKKAKAPMLLLSGERDSEVPVTQSFEHWHALTVLGVPTQLVVYPDEGHVPQQPKNRADVVRRIVGWFDKWLVVPPG